KTHPSMTIVAGRPGSGKTTLAHALARAIRCPAICRDEMKEGIVNSLSSAATQQDDVQRHTNHVFFKTIEFLLQHGVTLVAEAAFQHKLWEPRLQPLFSIATARVLVCSIDPGLAESRNTERGLADPMRERFHGAYAVQLAREGGRGPTSSDVQRRSDVP